MITRNTPTGQIQKYVGTTLELRPTPTILDRGIAVIFKDGAVVPVFYDPTLPATVDATDRVRAEAATAVRRARIIERLEARAADDKRAAAMGIRRMQLTRLSMLYFGDTVKAIYWCLERKRKHSDFVLSLADTIRSWLNGDSQYEHPLTVKQLNALINAYGRFRHHQI